MPNPVHALNDLLRVERPAFDIRTLDFQAPLVDKAARDLKLVKNAKANGIAGIPGSNDTQPSGFELKIHQYIERQIAETKASAEVAMMGLDDQIHHLDVEEKYKTLQRAPTDLRLRIQQVTHQAELALDRSREDLRASRMEYEGFQKERGIRREANYPDDKAPLLWIAFGIAAAEAILNAWFFAWGSERGLLGGLIMAMLFAFGDILVSFNLGRFIRKIMAPRLAYRILGGAAAIVFTGWAFSYNLVAGHLREALASMSWSAAVKESLSRFLANPIGLHDLESWILVGISMVLTLSVMGDGARYDESWFNFERLHRRMRRNQDEYDYHKQRALEDALKVKEDIVDTVRRSITEMQDRIATREVCIDRKEVLVRNYTTFIHTSQESCRAIVQLYRDENRRARSDKAPDYFQNHHDCDLGHKATEEQVEHRNALEEQRRMFKDAQEMRLEVLEQIDSEYEDAQECFIQNIERALQVGQ